MNRIEQSWIEFSRDEQYWVELNKIEQNWTELNRIEQNWTEKVSYQQAEANDAFLFLDCLLMSLKIDEDDFRPRWKYEPLLLAEKSRLCERSMILFLFCSQMRKNFFTFESLPMTRTTQHYAIKLSFKLWQNIIHVFSIIMIYYSKFMIFCTQNGSSCEGKWYKCDIQNSKCHLGCFLSKWIHDFYNVFVSF